MSREAQNKGGKAMRALLSAIPAAFLLAATANPVAGGEQRQEVRDDWAFQHRVMVAKDEKTRAVALRFAASRDQPAPLVDSRAGILKEDRDPTDVVARRADALLGHLGQAHPALPGWADLRKRLDPLLAEAKAGKPDLTGKDPSRQQTYTALCALRREIALANPLLDFEDVLLSEESNVGAVLQRTTTGQYNGLKLTEPGMALYVVRNWKSANPVVVDLCKDARVENGPYRGQTLAGGMFHAPSLSYDGKTALFSWARLHYPAGPETPEEAAQPDRRKKTADPLRIFRIAVDPSSSRGTGGTGLRQVNCDPGMHNDTEPCEMPDGRILFMSTRREVYDRCIAYRPAFTLCSMKPDGTDIVELSFHETHEWLPSIGNDGMILYTRWDYVDRSVHSAHGFWTCLPDGRDPRAPGGNYMWDNVFAPGMPYARFNPPTAPQKRQPCAVSHCHAIPGSRKVMAIGSWHHVVELGQVLLFDLSRPDDYAGGQITALTPGPWGGDRGGEFNAPWPLSEDFFLANCLDRIYLMDRFGNRELVYRSPRAHRRNALWQFASTVEGRREEIVKKQRLLASLDKGGGSGAKQAEDIASVLGEEPARGKAGSVGPVFAEDMGSLFVQESQDTEAVGLGTDFAAEHHKKLVARTAGEIKALEVAFAGYGDPWTVNFKGFWRPTFPRPIRPRARPPVVSTQTFQGEDRRGLPGHRPATIAIQNVYETDIPLPAGVKVKALRLVQVLGASTGNYNATGSVHGRNTSAVKIVLGTTPVEDDGSVHCLAPIEKGIYFQLLDQDGLAVQSMLSVTYVHPGERLSCRGCHERYDRAAPIGGMPLAMRRAPTTITPETPDGKVAPSEAYLVPAVDRVLAACMKVPGGPDTTDRGKLRAAGWLRYSEGFGVNQGDKCFRTTPDAFGARGSKLWEFIQANKPKLEGLEKDDIRLTALYMDLLCVGSSVYQNNVVQGPDGKTWPRHPDLDMNNPLGLEVVPLPDNRQAMNTKEERK
jgi:hypothetical protein